MVHGRNKIGSAAQRLIDDEISMFKMLLSSMLDMGHCHSRAVALPSAFCVGRGSRDRWSKKCPAIQLEGGTTALEWDIATHTVTAGAKHNTNTQHA